MQSFEEFSYQEDDIITTDKYLDLATNSDISKCVAYIQIDSLAYRRQVNFRGKVNPELSEFNKPNVITGHGDLEVHQMMKDFYPFKRWFSINKNCDDKNVFSLPLGITNNTNESEDHHIFGNTKIMLEVFKTPRELKHLAYLNVNPNTHPERRYVLEKFGNCDWVYKREPTKSLESRKQFLQDIRSSKFVLCPRGNGIDTHRLWETLYMGSIPIVRREIMYNEHTDLPILIVDRWEDVTPEFLEKKYEEIISKKWNFNKLKIGYWIEFIKNNCIL